MSHGEEEIICGEVSGPCLAESVCVLKCPSVKLNQRDFLGRVQPQNVISLEEALVVE